MKIDGVDHVQLRHLPLWKSPHWTAPRYAFQAGVSHIDQGGDIRPPCIDKLGFLYVCERIAMYGQGELCMLSNVE